MVGIPVTKKATLSILNDVSGIIKPGRMTLLLGPPSSGKTTLLLALAGRLAKNLKVLSEVTYNGHKLTNFVPQRTSSYSSQYDVHVAEMTVRETLEFAARCQGVGDQFNLLTKLASRERELLLYVSVHQMWSALFRLIAGLCRTMIIANTGGSIALLLVFVLGGFLIPRTSIKPWWIWAYWISPLSYAENAINVNEFLAPQWHKFVGGDTIPMGVQFLLNSGLFARGYWYWLTIGVMIGYTILFNVGFTLAITYLDPAGPQATISAENEEDSVRDVDHEANVERRRGMVLPFQPLSISFDRVSYYVNTPREMKAQGVLTYTKLQLLRGITGACRSGVLTALVGVSGAGKSTPMDVLAGRKTGGTVEGEIPIPGFPKNRPLSVEFLDTVNRFRMMRQFGNQPSHQRSSQFKSHRMNSSLSSRRRCSINLELEGSNKVG